MIANGAQELKNTRRTEVDFGSDGSAVRVEYQQLPNDASEAPFVLALEMRREGSVAIKLSCATWSTAIDAWIDRVRIASQQPGWVWKLLGDIRRKTVQSLVF